VASIQTVVFWVQAQRLKQTIGKMDEIAAQQTRDIQASITEATRAAQAMEEISKSMGESVQSVRKSVDINKGIADRQKLITELQSRAYLTTVFESMVPQNTESGVRFEPRLRLVNQGHTPAYNIRFTMRADVIPFPLANDFAFDLPAETRGRSAVIGPGLYKIISAVVPALYPEAEASQISGGVGRRVISWGIVKYRDCFGIERTCRFGLTYFRVAETQWMSQDTSEHNDSD
jgi:uncharacterized protein YggU (UPF0235/DUF167 family)